MKTFLSISTFFSFNFNFDVENFFPYRHIILIFRIQFGCCFYYVLMNKKCKTKLKDFEDKNNLILFLNE